ncbi:MAG: ABC transporter substrate-binding protein [Flavobacteriales bacterium]|nr:ABC transporter substrate-binding protein [Flavobacteriales bacterium]
MRALLGLFLLALATGCTAPTVETATVQVEPQRIITLNGTLTEIVAAIGLEDRIVGTDVTSKYPEAVNALPKLGHDRSIRAEGILSLSPDLVLANEGQLDPAVEGQIRQAGIRLMLFAPRNNIAGTKELIIRIADSLHRTVESRKIVDAIEEGLAAVVPLQPAPKVLFIYARGAGTLLVAGEGTPIQALIGLAGGTNAISGFSDFKPLTPEALVAADPDVVLLFNTGQEHLQGNEALMRVPGMASTSAGRDQAFITLQPVVMAGFGPRVGEAVTELNKDLRAATMP